MRKQIQKTVLAALKEIYQNLQPESNEELISNLQTIKGIFQEGLSANRFKFYAELIDGIILAVNQFSQESNDSAKQEMFALSKDLLKYVFTELSKEKEIKLDIVFLPYKASMWDSLESIWKAAAEDKEHCNAYVIPIPYADRKPDQSVAAWHCEADQYPKYVPVLDYRKVNLEELHPDVIFIHNPYDNYNALTSVDSQYYSDELKKCTDKLVYVPYFIAADIKPGDEIREENIAHLITTPAVLNADLVVVQSENIRQVYINVLLKYSTQKDRKYWEQRIVGLGSPKYDKVLSTHKEDVYLPKDWLKIIQKSDKTWKKVIFYNLGVSLALKWREKLLDKMEDDFRIFKEYKDEVALLWRPHPLLSATMAGMLPELQQRYETILKKYKEEGWGIYDDTSDLNRAMVISDAYFGDGSSVLRLYEITGKPIMYHTFRVFGKVTRTFKISSAFYENNQIWCTMFYDSYLYRIDLDTKEIAEVTAILDADELPDSYIFMLSYKDSFIFIKSNTNILIIMNRNDFKKTKYKIPSYSEEYSRLSIRFVNGMISDDNLYIVGLNYKGIVKFNLLTKEFSVIDDFMNGLKITSHNEKCCLYDYIKVDDKVYMPLMNTNAVLEFSLNDNSTKIHYVGDDKQRYVSGAWDGENIWLAPRDGRIGDIVKWNPSNDSVKNYENPLSKDEYASIYTFDKVLKLENSIIMLSLRGINDNLKIDLATEEITPFDDIVHSRFYLSNKYSCLHPQDQSITYIDAFNLIKYDFHSNQLEEIALKPTENLLNRIDKTEVDKLKFIFSPINNGNSIVYSENTKLNLHHLIKYLIIKD